MDYDYVQVNYMQSNLIIVHYVIHLINLVYVLLLSTLGSTLPSSPLNIISPITMWWEKIFYQLENLFQDDIILDIIFKNISNTIVA
jgi:hypothetical protein